MLFSDNSRVIMHGLMILLHFAYDVGEYMALRFPVFPTGVLAAFILAQVIFEAVVVHCIFVPGGLQGLSLLEFPSLFEESNTVYILLMPLVEKRG